jgi:uncharacterized protein (DUF1697 family)
MGTLVALLRGVNLGSNNRIAMPALREALTAGGFGDVRTYVQSGNIVLDSDQPPDELAVSVGRVLIDRFGLDVQVIARSADELAEVVAHNPFGDEATINPKALQVTFRTKPMETDELAALRGRAAGTEKVAAHGRELYSWHPDGIARSKLALAITPRRVPATARNWATVTRLLEMATNSPTDPNAARA